MKHLHPLRQALFDRLKPHRSQVDTLGQNVRRQIFDRLSKPAFDHVPESLLDKIQAHRLLQRYQTFQQAGGQRASMVQHGLRKALLKQKP